MASPGVVYRVLFVCTGNTCRSPLAVGALVQELGADASRVRVTSAGTSARVGEPATEHSINIAARDGVDIGAHRSRPLTSELVQDADLVLVMERRHLAAVREVGADPRRTFVLSEWPAPGEPQLSVTDPFGGSFEAYEECWRRIRRHVRRAASSIVEALRARSA